MQSQFVIKKETKINHNLLWQPFNYHPTVFPPPIVISTMVATNSWNYGNIILQFIFKIWKKISWTIDSYVNKITCNKIKTSRYYCV